MYVGLAALGVGVWYFLWGPGKQTGTTHAVSTSTFAPTSSTSPHLMPSAATADPCANARRLIAVGHPQEAQYWANQCQALGRTV
jgi:hypothetical protein